MREPASTGATSSPVGADARALRRAAGARVRHVEELLAAGAPDRRPAELRRLFEGWSWPSAGCRPRARSCPSPSGRTCSALAGRVAELAAELGASGVPASIDHCDLHAGNVLAPGDGYVFFDWHEGAVTHPFFSMVVATAGSRTTTAWSRAARRTRACAMPTSTPGPDMRSRESLRADARRRAADRAAHARARVDARARGPAARRPGGVGRECVRLGARPAGRARAMSRWTIAPDDAGRGRGGGGVALPG